MDHEVSMMAELDREYRERSGLTERRFYSIFYSRITQSPLMILGINPGGDPAQWSLRPNADEFCSQWQHDYVDERYPIQAAMLPLLTSSRNIDRQIVRRIPKTNMIFRRSSQEKFFSQQQSGMSMAAALRQAAPTLQKIIQHVCPRTIIFEGMGAMNRFVSVFGEEALSPSLVPVVTTPNGPNRAQIYAVHDIKIRILPHSVIGIALAHPSKYAGRAEFAVARADLSERLSDVGNELRALGSPLG